MRQLCLLVCIGRLASDCSKTVHSAQAPRAAVILSTGEIRVLEYTARNRRAIFEGDIVLGDADKVTASYSRFVASGLKPDAIVINGAQFRWPGIAIPYEVDPILDSAIRESINEAVNE